MSGFTSWMHCPHPPHTPWPLSFHCFSYFKCLTKDSHLLYMKEKKIQQILDFNSSGRQVSLHLFFFRIKYLSQLKYYETPNIIFQTLSISLFKTSSEKQQCSAGNLDSQFKTSTVHQTALLTWSSSSSPLEVCMLEKEKLSWLSSHPSLWGALHR